MQKKGWQRNSQKIHPVPIQTINSIYPELKFIPLQGKHISSPKRWLFLYSLSVLIDDYFKSWKKSILGHHLRVLEWFQSGIQTSCCIWYWNQRYDPKSMFVRCFSQQQRLNDKMVLGFATNIFLCFTFGAELRRPGIRMDSDLTYSKVASIRSNEIQRETESPLTI